jgi:purine-binding chemotaxis protein CheW
MTGKILCFELGTRTVGVDLEEVQEVSRAMAWTSVPGAPREIRGIFNLRGQVAALFDLARTLDPRSPSTEGRSAIILKPSKEGDISGFLVDRLGNVLEVGEDSCSPVPSHLPPREQAAFRELVITGEQVLPVLAPERIFGKDLQDA